MAGAGGFELRRDEVKTWQDMVGPLVDDHLCQRVTSPVALADLIEYVGPLLWLEYDVCLTQRAVAEVKKHLGKTRGAAKDDLAAAKWIKEISELLRGAPLNASPREAVWFVTRGA